MFEKVMKRSVFETIAKHVENLSKFNNRFVNVLWEIGFDFLQS